jgi:hypothetical protein
MAWRNENGIWRNGSEEKAHQNRRRKASKKMARRIGNGEKAKEETHQAMQTQPWAKSGGAIGGVRAALLGVMAYRQLASAKSAKSAAGVWRNHERKMAKIMAAHIEVSSGVAAWWRKWRSEKLSSIEKAASASAWASAGNVK